jgi:hypothetical protein
MKFRIAFDIEDADVRVATGDAPDVPPFADALQLLETLFLARLEAVGLFRVEVQRDADVHLDHDEHDLSSFARHDVQRRRGPITTETCDLVLVERDTQTGPRGHAQREVGVVQRLGEYFLRQQ